MIPVYATSAFLCIWYYWHAVYFQVISDCYEAFAIASFFALMCHYVAPDLHEQKDFFRNMHPIQEWVWPITWLAKCSGGEKGPWRTPKSGLTWFNIVWIGIYHYCFIRVAMTITAVVTQYFERYCESSNSPVFAHIWVCIAMLRKEKDSLAYIITGYWNRVYSGHYCYVLPHPVLHTAARTTKRAQAVSQGLGYKTCHLLVILANDRHLSRNVYPPYCKSERRPLLPRPESWYT